MGKPLLTDEMIERANRGEKISGPPLLDDEETKILPTSSSRLVCILGTWFQPGNLEDSGRTVYS